MTKLNKVIAAMTLAVAGTASAGQITSWTFINEAGFESFTGGPSVVGSGDATPNGVLGVPANTTLTWGTGLNNGVPGVINGGVDGLQSSFEVDSPVVGAIDTNGAAVDGTGLTHNNYVVGGADDGLLEMASFLDGIQLIPTELDGVPYVGPAFTIDAPVLGFDIDFLETLNGVDYSISGDTVNGAVLDDELICPDGTLNGTGVNVNGCADIFAVTSDTTDFEIVDGNIEFSGSFFLDMGMGVYEYTITTVLSGLELITDSACSAIGLASGCFGFLTVEEESNELAVEFRIESELVPVEVSAPATVAILGLGLIGLGGLARRKQSK